MVFYSNIESIYFLLPLVGFVVGLFGSMLGGGGGFIFLPILTLVLKVPAHIAVTTSLVATLPICIVGSWGHFRKGNVHLRLAASFALIGIIGALLGTYIVSMISPRVLKLGFGLYSVLIALNIGYATIRNSKQNTSSTENNDKVTRFIGKIKVVFSGFTAGAITGVLGTSATALVIAGLMNIRIPLKMILGTSLLVVLCNTLFAVFAHFFVSKVDMTLVCFLTAGSILGALIGPHLLIKANVTKSDSLVKYAYAVVLAVLGIVMIIK